MDAYMHSGVSIAMSTRNKASYLKRTLESIVCQNVPGLQIIIADDGSTDETCQICNDFGVEYVRLNNDRYRNPSVARNAAYRRVKHSVVICQSDDVIHVKSDTIVLLSQIAKGTFNIATVINWHRERRQLLQTYTGPEKPNRPYFFLGALRRNDLYAVGGCDEEFTEPGFDDNWFGDCLIRGLKLRPNFLANVIGYHQHHSRPDLSKSYAESEIIYKDKVAKATNGHAPWKSTGAPWKITCQEATENESSK